MLNKSENDYLEIVTRKWYFLWFMIFDLLFHILFLIDMLGN